jgi:hypothetical protein
MLLWSLVLFLAHRDAAASHYDRVSPAFSYHTGRPQARRFGGSRLGRVGIQRGAFRARVESLPLRAD